LSGPFLSSPLHRIILLSSKPLPLRGSFPSVHNSSRHGTEDSHQDGCSFFLSPEPFTILPPLFWTAPPSSLRLSVPRRMGHFILVYYSPFSRLLVASDPWHPRQRRHVSSFFPSRSLEFFIFFYPFPRQRAERILRQVPLSSPPPCPSFSGRPRSSVFRT